jgi:type VI secretion system protein ImpH
MATARGGNPAPVKGAVGPAAGAAAPGQRARSQGENGHDGRAPGGPPTLEQRLWEEPYAFDFFQAVRILERLYPDRRAVGREGPARGEVARFRAHLSLSFPPSALYELDRPTESLPAPLMTVAFFGLYGPSGVLPRHYTELLLRLQRDGKGPEKTALRAWFDLFNHRVIALFFRAWEKYRFYVPYERKEYALSEPDPFTRALLSMVGLGTPRLRHRLRVSFWDEVDDQLQERILAEIDDLVLLHYGGFLAHRRCNAVSLEAMLADYFRLPVRVRQFQGQWLRLDEANQSRMGPDGPNNLLGTNLVAGDRVWDVQGKIRIRVGPLTYPQFTEFLPDRTPVARRKQFFVLVHLVRLFVGPALDFDVQVVLRADEVPWCKLGGEGGSQLGWNTWVRSLAFPHDVDDPVFEGEEVVFLNPDRYRPPEHAAEEMAPLGEVVARR